jgi:hypothetical protein
MKQLLWGITFSLLATSLPVKAQQTNIYSVCTNYQENYAPGYYDAYGNYVQGNVNTQRYNVQCGTGTYYRPNGGNVYQSPVAAPIAQPGYGRGYCSPARTTLGGLLGGGIGAAVSKKDAWSWAIPLGAVLGAGAANATCY